MCYLRVVSATPSLQYPSLKKVCELKGHDNEIESLTCHPSEEQVRTEHEIIILCM